MITKPKPESKPIGERSLTLPEAAGVLRLNPHTVGESRRSEYPRGAVAREAMNPENDRKGHRRRVSQALDDGNSRSSGFRLLSMRGFLLQTMAKTQLRRLASYANTVAGGPGRSSTSTWTWESPERKRSGLSLTALWLTRAVNDSMQCWFGSSTGLPGQCRIYCEHWNCFALWGSSSFLFRSK